MGTLGDIEQAARKCPIELQAAIVADDIIGTPEAVLAVHNRSSQDVIAFTAIIHCFDRFDTPIRKYGAGDSHKNVICQDTIPPHKPGKYMNIETKLHGFDTASKIRVEITRVKLEDDSEWVPEDGINETVEGGSYK